MSLKRIVVTGPESTGKSSLCEALAAHFHTGWVPEYAREYLLKNGREYGLEDLSRIARGQVAQEDRLAAEAAAAGKELLFIDTDLYVIRVWSEFVFDRCDPWILDQIAVRRYDAYLLCRTDLPWIKDELREYPDLETRERLFRIYRETLAQQTTPWMEIGGAHEARVAEAVAAVKQLSRPDRAG